MKAPTRTAAWFGGLHLALVLLHDVAHWQLAIFASPLESTFIALVLHLLPLAAILSLRRAPRSSSGWLAAALALSFSYGTLRHFVWISPDHVSYLPRAAATLPFQLSALLLALVDGGGALALIAFFLRATALLPGRRHILLVDGACVFCNGLVSLILRLDRQHTFHFAHIQGAYARELLVRYGRDPNDVDPIYLVANAGSAEEQLLVDGQVSREVWPRLFFGGAVVRLMPLPLLNAFYAGFARIRYRVLGKYEHCYVPTAAERARYLE